MPEIENSFSLTRKMCISNNSRSVKLITDELVWCHSLIDFEFQEVPCRHQILFQLIDR